MAKKKPDPLTTGQAADELRLSVRRVQELCKDGPLDTTMFGRAYVITRASLEAFRKLDRPYGGAGHKAYLARQAKRKKRPKKE